MSMGMMNVASQTPMCDMEYRILDSFCKGKFHKFHQLSNQFTWIHSVDPQAFVQHFWLAGQWASSPHWNISQMTGIHPGSPKATSAGQDPGRTTLTNRLEVHARPPQLLPPTAQHLAIPGQSSSESQWATTCSSGGQNIHGGAYGQTPCFGRTNARVPATANNSRKPTNFIARVVTGVGVFVVGFF